MKKIQLLFVFSLFLLVACKTKESTSTNVKKITSVKDYSFETVANDPTNTQVYTLKNGLKVYLSINKDEPRIQSNIAVKAGSKFDPAETTGLAHYLEHMMFKGTHKIGTKDWEKEKLLLAQIAKKFEEHKNEPNEDKKKAIYKEIDHLSYEASKLAIANEYDKMVSSLGAKGTNAYTSNERTVYVNDIPSNELEKFLKIEGERFQTLVLRLFHTELETVYEEFNRSQDNDGRWVYQGVLEGLFPNHPYGTQTTIGVGEHLKNPSLYNIENYFNNYYRPNNVAICLSGDLDPNKTIALIEKYFGDWEKKDIPEFIVPEYTKLTKPVIKETFGPQQETVYLGYQFDGAGTKDAMMLSIIDMLLANSQAGLIDLDLNLSQKVLSAGSFPQILKDHSVHLLYGYPKKGQTLDEVKDLLLKEIEKVKTGDFDDWLVEAVVTDLKLNRIRTIEKNNGRASLMVDAFINDLDWNTLVHQFNEMEKITKADIMAFAKDNYKENYVVSYKKMGEAKRHSVPKPEITQLELDRESKSEFLTEFEKMKSTKVAPVFIDFENEILRTDIKGLPFSYINNKTNELFSLSYIFDMGSDHSKEMALAVSYLPYLGTEKYNAEDLKKQFFKLGLDFKVNTGRDRMYITLSGLEKNLKEGVELFEHILLNVKPDKNAYKDLVASILKKRTDAKLDKRTILRNGLVNMAKYGTDNPFTDKLSAEELRSINIDKLTQHIKELTNYAHRVFYYGKNTSTDVLNILEEKHAVDINLEAPEKKIYKENEFNDPKIYFTHYDMQQVELYLLAPDNQFDPKYMAASMLFNEYFGSGLSSIVFQEIREKKALAYSAYAWYSNARNIDENNYLYGYIGTQHDKLKDAVGTMFEILNEMPEASLQFEGAKQAVMKKIATSRKVGPSIYWEYEGAQKRGLDYDINNKIYEQVSDFDLNQLNAFFEEHIKGKNFSICVIGNEKTIDKNILKSMGEFQEVNLKESFGY